MAFTKAAPLEGGPFVTVAGGKDAIAREPRGRTPEAETEGPKSKVQSPKFPDPGPVEKK